MFFNKIASIKMNRGWWNQWVWWTSGGCVSTFITKSVYIARNPQVVFAGVWWGVVSRRKARVLVFLCRQNWFKLPAKSHMRQYGSLCVSVSAHMNIFKYGDVCWKTHFCWKKHFCGFRVFFNKTFVEKTFILLKFPHWSKTSRRCYVYTQLQTKTV